MSNRRFARDPSYRLHKQSGQAVVTLTDGLGGRRDVLLGKHDTPASRARYRRALSEWEANGRRLPSQCAPDLTVAELIARYWQHVETYYRHPDGNPTGEVQAMKYALRPLNYLLGATLVKDFGPTALKTVRELMVSGYEHPKHGRQQPVCRNQVNARVKRVRRMIKWAVANELAPASLLPALQAVEALKRGRTAARESSPVLPVARAVVEETLPLLRPMQADMVRLQLESGMRPGELVSIRAIDIDMTGRKVWLFRPGRHKTEHHGHQRVIVLGPKCQEIIRRYLSSSLETPLFSPAANMEERRLTMRANRKSKVQPSQASRARSKPRKKPGAAYTVTTYARAIAEAIKRHNAGKPASEHLPHWHPHQLRHQRALELKREAGLDAARAVLGHRSPVITEHYGALDVARASEVMGRIG